MPARETTGLVEQQMTKFTARWGLRDGIRQVYFPEFDEWAAIFDHRFDADAHVEWLKFNATNERARHLQECIQAKWEAEYWLTREKPWLR
jgi:hypothetical protein